jgi:hypothetical protein
MRSGGRWAVAIALLAGVVFAWPTYVRYFGLYPGAMIAALLIAFAMYLPSLWAVRFLDRHDPEPLLLFSGSVSFVILFAPITSRVMHAVIDGGLLPYWVVVGPLEELTKLLPLALLAAFGGRADLSSPLGAALLAYSEVANTVVMNLLVWPVLAWGILYSRNPEARR